MQISLPKLGKVEVDYYIDRDDIHTTSKQVSRNETACVAVLEVMVNPNHSQ